MLKEDFNFKNYIHRSRLCNFETHTLGMTNKINYNEYPMENIVLIHSHGGEEKLKEVIERKKDKINDMLSTKMKSMILGQNSVEDENEKHKLERSASHLVRKLSDLKLQMQKKEGTQRRVSNEIELSNRLDQAFDGTNQVDKDKTELDRDQLINMLR